ncbi:putative GPI-anchored protein-like isoform X1 [Iris pallida]|uniref:GPI-anchored protein-like isoform X1 n=1 Tax=Iris pallida TaxID=29817 RepID=A0AAX6ETS3_IRIPA|nr:putative GPI-anchored protein-like isoform X1 [Iris pallida]
MGGQALLLLLPPPTLSPLALILLLLCVQDLRELGGVTVGSTLLPRQLDSPTTEAKDDTFMPKISPNNAPEPLIPFLAPSPLAPYFNNSAPQLSGQCTLNFSAVDHLISTTAVDCWASFAPFLANVICCPQLQATLVILIGQSSKESGMLALDSTHANHCLSDVQQILGSQGASYELPAICAIQPANLTEGSCPVKDINGLESVVDSSQLLSACKKVDPVNECCSQICQNAILDAARKMASNDGGLASMGITDVLPEHASRVDDCRSIVLRWLSSRLDRLSAMEVLRRLSNCNVNGACPLTFEDTKSVADHCGNIIKNHTACCKSMSNYVSHLQKQSFITNLQALDCASLLGSELEKMNVTTNIYSFCHITLKDFSLQVGSQESGCLLPSLPSDATFDPYTGISFTCDLNDNIAAPWPSTSQLPSSSCNKTVNMPALPAATSAQRCGYRSDLKLQVPIALLLAFMILMG